MTEHISHYIECSLFANCMSYINRKMDHYKFDKQCNTSNKYMDKLYFCKTHLYIYQHSNHSRGDICQLESHLIIIESHLQNPILETLKKF